MSKFEDVYKKIQDNRANRLEGNYNSIPWNLGRLTSEFN